MPFLCRYFLIVLLALRSALPAGQTTVEPGSKPELVEKAEAEQIESPPAEPAEPVEAPAPPKRRHARPETRFQVQHHPDAIFGQNIVVKKDESIRELVLIGGTAVVEGHVERDLVIIGGKADVSGSVGGELVVIGGSLRCSGEVQRHTKAIMSRATITDTARLERGGFFLGGPFQISPGAAITGERVIIPFGDVVPKVEGLKAWLVEGLMWGRLLPMGVRWAWTAAGIFVGIYLLTLVLFPAAVKAIFLALEERPVTSILSGFLTLILFAPLVAILIIAVVGIPVVPFLQVALILALLFGKAAVMCFLGRSFGRSAGAAFLQAPMIALLIGATLLVLAYMIPVFGVLAWILATVFGLGGAVVALSRTFKREEAAVPLAPVLVGATAAGPSMPAVAAGIPPLAGSANAPTPQMPADTVLLPRAGFWKRLLADLLDFVLLGLLVPSVGKWFIVIAVAYFVGMWTWKGTTIGSTLLRLRVVRTDGTPVTFSVALVRSLSSLFSALVLFLGFLWSAWDREKQSWHDKIAGTVVVQMPKGFALL